MFLYILLALLIFGFLIFIHEGGHFIAARICGVTVNEFAIGMGPKIFSWTSKKSGTHYRIRLLPIGGFVNMEGEEENSESEGAFCNKSVPKRMFIIIAGALMNILLGFILMFVIVVSQKDGLASTKVAIFNDNALSSEKIMVGDTVLKVDGTRVHTGYELLYEVQNSAYEPIEVVVLRDGEKVVLNDVTFPTYEYSGVLMGDCDFRVFAEEDTFGNIMKHSFYRSVSTVKMIYDSLFNLITGKYGMDAISGPVGVTQVIGETVESVSDMGANAVISTVLSMVTLISINLGVFNLIPFPALDGGQFLFLIIEGIRRKPVDKRIQGYINFAGIMLLFALMAIVTLKDIIKIILG